MKKILIIFLAFMLIPAVAFCSTKKVLEKDTELHPQGWIAGSLEFKQGTTVELNDRGEVISGVLRKNKYLRTIGSGTYYRGGSVGAYPIISPGVYSGAVGFYAIGPYYTYGNILYFKGSDCVTTFDERGYVVSGTLAEDTSIYIISYAEPGVKFRDGTAVSFDKNGYLIKGTLADDTFLRPVGWTNHFPQNAGFINFKAKTEVVFGPNAQVIEGTIANDLTVNGITYPAGTTLQFSESDNPKRI